MTNEIDLRGLAEGERRKEDRLDLLRERRAVYVRRGQRALLLRLLGAETATADDVAAVVELPPDIDGRCLGAVPGTLARLGLVGLVGYERSARPNRHASPQAVWQLVDRDAAAQWLAAYPDMPDPPSDDQDAAPAQLTLDYQHICRLDAATADAVRSHDGLSPGSLRRFYLRVRAACDRLGIERGALQMCRRTGATYVERDQSGAAMRYLGHRTPGLAYRHYVDRSKLGDAVQPPEL